MARFTMDIESGGRKLKSADVTVYTEDSAVAVGNEAASFTDSDKATIYSDNDMTAAASNPLQSDDLGEVEFFMSSLSQVAIKVSRSGYGTRWHRFIDITGTDPA